MLTPWVASVVIVHVPEMSPELFELLDDVFDEFREDAPSGGGVRSTGPPELEDDRPDEAVEGGGIVIVTSKGFSSRKTN